MTAHAFTQQLNAITARAEHAIASAPDAHLGAVRLSFLGIEGPLMQLAGSIGATPIEDRPMLGERVNIARMQIEALIDDAETRTTRRQHEELLKR